LSDAPAKEGLSASDVGAALKGAMPSSAALEVPVDVALQSASAGSSSPGLIVDDAAIDVEISVGDSNPPSPLVAMSGPDDGAAQPAFLISPLNPHSNNRRRVLFGAIGAAAVIGLLAIALGLRTRSPARVGVSAQASAKSAVGLAPTALNTENAPPASAASAATQTAPEASATTVAEPAASAPVAAEEEEVKIAVNIKPDGSLFYYKGRIVGRTPFILKQPRGEKRTYEVGKDGYATRRVVVVGTERSLGFELGLDVPHPDSL
jgi:hypothetical protein